VSIVVEEVLRKRAKRLENKENENAKSGGSEIGDKI
jgi:hypothetical protein